MILLVTTPPRANFAVSQLDDVFLLEALGVSTPEALLWLEREVLSFGNARNQRAAYLHCIGPKTKNDLPSEPVRKAMIQFAKNASKAFTCAAFVMETPGFTGAAFRSLFSGIMFVARLDLPAKIFSDVESALRWIHTQSPATTLPAKDAIEKTREQLFAGGS